jgi:hypothetical protein
MQLDVSRWSGDGEFTKSLIDVLGSLSGIAAIRIEDSPAGSSGSGYLFLSNEIYVEFEQRVRVTTGRWLGLIPVTRRALEPVLTLAALESLLGGHAEVGPPDFSDDSMLQYLRTERIVPPYQTRGYKLVEMVRIYGVERPPQHDAAPPHPEV